MPKGGTDRGHAARRGKEEPLGGHMRKAEIREKVGRHARSFRLETGRPVSRNVDVPAQPFGCLSFERIVVVSVVFFFSLAGKFVRAARVSLLPPRPFVRISPKMGSRGVTKLKAEIAELRKKLKVTPPEESADRPGGSGSIPRGRRAHRHSKCMCV